jgi:glyoxylase-like metal-dependent hydrolase (beta-lactamase superfamily II)
MMRRTWACVALMTTLAACGTKAPLDAADAAMGASRLTTIHYAGAGTTYGFQQAPVPGGPWPRFDLETYDVSIDYAAPAMRIEEARKQGEHPPRGGSGQPIAGVSRTVQLVNGKDAWTENASGAANRSGGNAAADRTKELWLTPHGVIKAAMTQGLQPDGKTFTVKVGDQDVEVTLNDQYLVERTVQRIDHPQLGDTEIETRYSEYQEHDGGIRFPKRILEITGGHPTLDVTIAKVEPNATVSLAAPEAVKSAASPPPPAAAPATVAQQVKKGVWYLTIGNPRSVAVEFADHVVVVEGPSNDRQTYATTDWIRKNIPNKPIRYVVNTHHHFDHSGGLRGYVAQGITVITHEINKPYYEEIWKRPHTINPDSLSRNPKPAVFETLTDRKVLRDGSRTLELHHIQNHGHAPGYIMAYLPAEKTLIYADSYNPPAGDDPRDRSRTNEFLQGLYDNIQRLKLDVTTLAPLHGRVVPFDNLKKALGVIPVD